MTPAEVLSRFKDLDGRLERRARSMMGLADDAAERGLAQASRCYSQSSIRFSSMRVALADELKKRAAEFRGP